MKIRLTVNGKEYSPQIKDEEMSLLFYLRNVLGLTAAKNGCNEGHCGACTVIIDGEAKLSCVRKLKDMDGKNIVTLEALSTEETIHPVQYAYIKEGAIQCGFCTPGMIMATKALLDKNPKSDEGEIKKALSLNLCRCTGYTKIIKAVKKAAELMKKGVKQIEKREVYPQAKVTLGSSIPRIDALSKVTGELKYADDLSFKNMLYARVLRSPYPHTEIVDLNISQALNTEGVATILTAQDIPGRKVFGPIVADQPILVDRKVRYVGDALAAVYAESEKIAEEALKKIKVGYRLLPVVSNPQEALKEGAPLLHDENDKNSNIFCQMESGRGDVEEGFKEADIILEDNYKTQFVEHAYLEPESCIAVPEKDGKITIYVGSQGPEDDIKQIAPALNLPPEKIHIAHIPMGGGFGGRQDITVQIIAALGALKTKHPVKYTFTRRESIRVSGKRHANYINYKTGITKEGKISAVQARIYADSGAYASVGEAVILRSVSFGGGPYAIPNADLHAYGVYTNNVPACAMRGFGNPAVSFAAEMQINRLAEKLNLDPFEVRLKNVLEEGLPTTTGDRIKSSVGIKSCLLAVKKALERTKIPESRAGWKIGVGIASSYKNVGFGIGMEDFAGAYGEVVEDGILLLRFGAVDMGQGSSTVMAQIASERIGWPYSKIKFQYGDTERDPLAMMTTASRQTFVSGNAVYYMAGRLKDKIFKYLANKLKVKAEDIEIRNSFFYLKSSCQKLISLSELSEKIKEEGIRLFDEYKYIAPKTHFSLKEPPGGYKQGKERLHVAYCFGAQAVILEVNEKTGKVNVLKVIAAHDVGRIINRAGIEGQIEGGVMMGLGYTLSEEFILKEGKIITDTLGKLGLPRISKTPEIESIIIENPHSEGPYGAKGMGELTVSMAAPAVLSAIHDALGIWLTSIPATPEKITKALNKQ